MTESLRKSALLVDTLYKRTASDSISWEIVSPEKVIRVVRAGSVIQLAKQTSGSRVDYIISIWNDEGVRVDRFEDADLDAEFAPTDQNYETYFELMEDLFIKAMRAALGADKILDELLKDLGSD